MFGGACIPKLILRVQIISSERTEGVLGEPRRGRREDGRDYV